LKFPNGFLWIGISMSGEVSYFSRFFVKFVEIIAAGLASAISAYLLAHFWGLVLSSPTPASAPAQTAVQVGPTASEVTEGLRARPTPPVAAAAVAAVAQPAKKAGKDAKASPPRKHTKTDTSVAEKEPRGQNSAEALIRAAIANVDANRPAPADALMGPGLTDTRSAPVDVQPRQAVVPSRQADVVPRPVDVPPRAATINAASHAADVQPQPVLPRPATGADLQPRSPVRATVDSLPPSASPPLEIAAPRRPPAADQDKGVFSALERIPDLLRPDPPPAIGETPRPPMPVGTALPE
jgi:hypothetical protein